MPEISYTTLWNLSEEEVAKALQNSRISTPKLVLEDFERVVVATACIGSNRVLQIVPILHSDEYLARVYGIEDASRTLLTTAVPHEGSWAVVISSRLKEMIDPAKGAGEDHTAMISGYLVAHEIGKLMTGYHWHHHRNLYLQEDPLDPVFPEGITDVERAMKLIMGGTSRDAYEADRYVASLLGIDRVMFGLAFLLAEAAMVHDTHSHMEINNRIILHARSYNQRDYIPSSTHHSFPLNHKNLWQCTMVIKVLSTGCIRIPTIVENSDMEELLAEVDAM